MTAALHAFTQDADDIRPIPHALGVEKSVLSVLLQTPEKLDDAPQLTPKHFHIPAHRFLFERVSSQIVKGESPEFVSFVEELRVAGLLERVGGPAAVVDIWNHAVSDSHFEMHVGILSQNLARRMTIDAADKMRATAFEAESASDILEVTSAPISEIHDLLTGNREERSTKAVVHACLDRFQRRVKNEETAFGIETSLTEFNHRFKGLHPKQTIVVSGYPGGGKTTLAGQFAMDSALSEKNTLICSLEMPEESLMDRMLAYVARRPGDAICDPLKYCKEVLNTQGPTLEMLQAIQLAALKITAAPFAIEDLIGANAYQIGSCIRRSHRKRPLDVVVVDYAQRMRPVPEKIRESREQQLSHASNYLADLSKELGCCLILPSQLNKDGAAKHAEAINEDADLHLQIVQDRDGANPTFDHIGIAVVKDRHHGQDGTLLPIVLDGPMLRFIPKPFKK